MEIEIVLSELALKLKNKIPQIDITPVSAYPMDGGYDLSNCSKEPVVIGPFDTVKFHTGVYVHLGSQSDETGPEMTLGMLLLPKSSCPGLKLSNTIGLCDYDYQGEVIVKYVNTTENQYTVQPGDQIAQMVIIPIFKPKLKVVKKFSKVSARGTGGFGSTTEKRIK